MNLLNINPNLYLITNIIKSSRKSNGEIAIAIVYQRTIESTCAKHHRRRWDRTCQDTRAIMMMTSAVITSEAYRPFCFFRHRVLKEDSNERRTSLGLDRPKGTLFPRSRLIARNEIFNSQACSYGRCSPLPNDKRVTKYF